MAKKPIKTLDDFGFSLVSESDLKRQEEETTDKLHGLRDMIMPFLKNMTKDPDKEYIMWPDRAAKVQAFIDKINAYVDGE